MALAAHQVVVAIAERLKVLDEGGDRVFTNPRTLQPEQVPAWIVTTEGEDIERLTINPQSKQRHTLTVNVRGIAADREDLFDVLNNSMAVPALRALFHLPEDAALRPLTNVQMRHASTSRSTPNEREGRYGSIDLSLVVTFNTIASDPETLC